MATRSARDNKALNARHAEVLKAMLRQPENKLCADCKRNDPRWASTNLGCFMCIRCSGIHRSMGVHITRIKSIDLDTWTSEQVACVQRWGNKRANAYWEAHLRPGHMPPDHKIESFIRSKYESKRWAMEGPLPEPETLDDDQDVTPAPAAVPVTVSQKAAPSMAKVNTPTMSKPTSAVSTTSNTLDFFDTNDQSTKPNPVGVGNNNNSSQASGNGGGLFDLDFTPQASANAVTATAPAARKDVKNDILSLFSNNNKSNQTYPNSATPNMNAVNNQFNGLNFGSNQQVHNPNNSSTQSQTNAFVDHSHNVWGSSPTGPSQQQQQHSPDLFGSFTSGTNPPNAANKDVFSDIWS
ncbi:hypothetical protein PSTG_12826 [Puccinia striiformis f. sp. tritici PST-78]|uniref:Arf-GAP domain-containing protein n=1 Tax=Puccinia striiformis f. sp. tritici PST-78 TaxID=1165861 RepID=A0A0L0V3D1_9BASI|nr:hypothetical protein PSTG_12826 [Puccinia striiformis f. sp. tritici PST-78]